MTIGGGALLVAAVGLGAGLAGVVARRGDLGDRARAIAGEVLSGGGWTPALEQERDHLLEIDRRMFGAVVGLAVSSGVAAAVGVGLVVAGEHRRARPRAEVVPYGGAQAAGLLLRGRF